MNHTKIHSNSKNRISITNLNVFQDSNSNYRFTKFSDGNEIIKILNRIKKMDLSNDAKKILDIALLTNSFLPDKNIENENFLNFKFDYLIESNNLKLIEIYLLKNNNYNNSRIIKFYINQWDRLFWHYYDKDFFRLTKKIKPNLNSLFKSI